MQDSFGGGREESKTPTQLQNSVPVLSTGKYLPERLNLSFCLELVKKAETCSSNPTAAAKEQRIDPTGGVN